MPNAPFPSAPQPPPELRAFLEEYETFFLVGHVEPDGDCIAAALALASFLERVLGKRAHCLNAGPFDRREIRSYRSEFRPRLDRSDRDRAVRPAAIILDCSGPERTGALEDDIAGLPVAIVDHHATTNASADASFLVPTAAATCYLAQLIIEGFDADITPREAELLLFGIATDTGFFRHVESGAADLMAGVSRLLAAGASPKQAHAQMTGGHTLGSRQLLGALLHRAEPIGDGAGVISWETAEDLRRYGRESRDSDTLYQLLFGIAGVRAAALVRYESETTVSGSLRSIDDLDVSEIAASFHGGGHRRAAGFTTELELSEAIDRVRARLEAALAPPEERNSM